MNIELSKEANQLQNQVVYHVISKAIILAAEMRLDNHLSDIPIKIDELARRLGYHPQSAHRLFRLLETLNLLEITAEDLITATYLTPYIKQVYSEHYFGSFAAFNYFQNALENNKECWSDAFGKPFYDYLKDNPNKLNEFQLYLEDTAESWLDFIPYIFEFSEYNNIVDVGGGKGQLLAKIIKSVYEKGKIIKGVLFEKPEIIQNAFSYLSLKNLSEKISLVKGDFFMDELPEGDVYILCRVLLNWGDDSAIKIIANCLRKMTGRKKLIIVDFVIPNKEHKHYQRAILHDLNLLAVFGGGIRTLSDWKTLITKSAKSRKAKYKIIDEDLSPSLNVPMVIIEL